MGRGGYLGDRCAPKVWSQLSPGAGRVRAPRLPTLQTLEPGPHVEQRRPGPGCTDPGLPRLAIGVVFNPGNPLGPGSPAPFPLPPLKPALSSSMEARRRPGGAGVDPRLRPHASPRPSSHLRASAPQPPALSLPTTRLLCCSSWPCSLECTGLAEPSPAPLRGDWGRAWARKSKGREKLERRSPSFGGLSARRGWGGGIREPSPYRRPSPCGGKMRASCIPELLRGTWLILKLSDVTFRRHFSRFRVQGDA